MQQNKDTLKRLIKRRHPQYDLLKTHWDFLEQTYNGGRDWFKDNLFQYIKEGEKEYEERLQRAYRFNHTREVVDLVDKYLFKAEIIRNEAKAPDYIKRFWKGPTRSNIPMSEFSRQLSRKSSIYGSEWVVVDNTAKSAPKTKREEKISGVTAYAYTVKPQNVLDFAYDDNGNLLWLLLYEPTRDDADPFTSSGDFVDRYRLWTQDSWYLYEVSKRGAGVSSVFELDSNEHGLGEVPLVRVDNQMNDDLYAAPSFIGDIAYLDRAVANYLSNLDAVIQDQTFSQLAMPAQGILPGDDAYNALLAMGTKRIFLYDGESGSAPMYISPDVKQAHLILDVVHKIINEIYHSVGVAGERTKQDNSMGIDNSSGVAKAFDFDRVNALLSSKASSLESGERKVLSLVAKWNGESDIDTESLVKYPRDFDVRGLYDEFDIATRLSAIEAPDFVRREQMKDIVDKLFPVLSKDLLTKMRGELESWPPKIELDSWQAGGPSGGKKPQESLQ